MAPLHWEQERGRWPHATCSRFVEAGGLRWHVQSMGRGPVALLLHGAGASSHSWRDLMPRLSHAFTVVAPDLPGHGFTSTPENPAGLSMGGMATALAALLNQLGLTPRLGVGHSAGAAILLEMCRSQLLQPALVVGLNSALLPLPGLRGMLFAPLARVAAGSALLPRLCAWRAGQPGAIERLIESTGSHLDARGVALYQRLASEPRHVAATLEMMARWDLARFAQTLSACTVPLVLVTGDRDKAVSPRQAGEAAALIRGAEVIRLRGVGHLAHEERPQEISTLILAQSAAHGLIPTATPLAESHPA